MMRKLVVLFTLFLFAFSCGYEQVGWDELAGGASQSSIPSAAPAGADEDGTNPWSTEDDGDEGDDSEKPSDDTGKGDEGGEEEGDSENGKPSGADTGNGNNPTAGDGEGEREPESPKTDSSESARLKFSLTAKDARTRRTYIRSAGKLRADSKIITATITKKAGDTSSFYGVVLHLKGNSEFLGFLVSSDGSILIGKMKGGKWKDLKKIEDSEHMAKGLNQNNALEVKIEEDNIRLSVNSSEVYEMPNSDLDDISRNTDYGIMAVSSGSGVSESIIFDIRQM